MALLGVILFANILAGHSILELVSFQAVAASILPAHWAMEAGMALLQAYVFTALLLIYAGETFDGVGWCCFKRLRGRSVV